MHERSTLDRAEWAALQRRMQERRWLLAASCIVVLGLGLAFAEKMRAFGDVRARLARGEVVDLSVVESSRALEAVFAVVYPDAADRRVAAAHLYGYLVRAREAHRFPGPLRNVGQLHTAALGVPVAVAERGGVVFRERAAGVRARGGRSVPLLGDAAALRAVKPRLVVRGPAAFAWLGAGLAALYLAAFWAVHLYWHRRRFAGDPALLPVVHLLTGLGLVVMFSIPDPLRDTVLAQGFVGGVVVACGLTAVVSRLDFQHRFWRRRTYLWLLLGVGTAVALYVAGSGPTGSDARVNLRVPGLGSVQPVELIKLFLVLFLAGYFGKNWVFLRELQQREGVPRWLAFLQLPRYRYLMPVAAGVGAALLTFFLLKDMGPALVVGCTFLVLYGVARRRWVAAGAGFAAIAGTFAYTYRTNAVPVVADRIAMLLSPWENFAAGGEHLAHAYWAMAAGGVAGQGLGAGSPAYVPAAHTDMVLAALAEEAGLAGLVAVALLYGVLLGRTFRIALRAGGDYSLFLCLGVGLLLLFQGVLIAGGVFGLLPLSGVVTPLLSYGKSSMALAGVLVGILASVSARPGDEAQAAAQRAAFRAPVRLVGGAALVAAVVLLAKAGYVHLAAAGDWTIRPALVVRAGGERAFTYNPRLYDARARIPRGAIYDRNGIPLATSRWDEVEAFRSVYDTLGVDLARLDRAGGRYYPFGALAFYLVGDLRTRVKWGAGNSLYAEHAYLSHLRGYDNTPAAVEKRKTRGGDTEPLVRYDYRELAALVRFGPESAAGRALLALPRDVRLTVDVRLQQRVAQVLAARVPEGQTASVVVLDAAAGDVLASVTYPLPEEAYTDPSAAHRRADLFDRGYGRGAKPPGSTFKLVTALAALQRDSLAARRAYTVRAADRYARRGEPTGRVDLRRALVASSNVYFAALAREVVGADTLLRLADAFGFGVGRPGLDPRRRRALLEAPDNLRQAGFGQGPVTGSPLQVALVAAAVANGGVVPAVRWVQAPAPERRAPQRVATPAHARLLAAYMRGVVTDREGTARQLRTLTVPVAGKTGTAEERVAVQRGGRRVLQTVDHAWFTGFAPYTPPDSAYAGRRVAIAVLVEGGGHGGQVAAPIAGAVAEAAAALGIIPPGRGPGNPESEAPNPQRIRSANPE